MTQALPIEPAEVAWHVEQLARFGAHGATGVWRTVYSPEWLAAQQQLTEWFQAAGLSVRQDAVGNLWGRLEGTAGGRVIATGSHVDSQRPGGQYDGALGITAALLAVKHLRQAYGPPRRPIEVVSLCEEESSRFPTAAYWGSRAITGQVRPEHLTEVRDLTACRSATSCAASASTPTASARRSGTISTPSSSCISSRGRSWRTPVCRSPSSAASPACGTIWRR
jgi:allantoate deiminase